MKRLYTPLEQAASGGDASRLSPEELLAQALRAFKQDADNAAQRASRSQSPSLQLPADAGDSEQLAPPPQLAPQPPQQLLQQSSSLPDLSKGAAAEQSPAEERPSPATSEPVPQEHQNWGVLRPTPQRIGLRDAPDTFTSWNSALASSVTPCALLLSGGQERMYC